MAWYRTGTVAVTSGSPNVVGTGTLWLNYGKDGDGILLPDGKVYEVLDIPGNGQITLATNYSGSSASGQAYALFPTHAFSIQLAAAVSQLYSDFSGYAATALLGRFGDGASSAPGVSFSSDTDTGFYRPGANVIAFSTGGVERFRVSSGGLMGIGTDTPGYKLDVKHVSDSEAIVARFAVANTANTDSGELQFLADSANNVSAIRATGLNGTALRFDTGSTERMRVTSSGDLGFGTASPAYFAHFSKNQAASTRVVVSNNDAAAFTSFDAVGSNTTLRMEVATAAAAATVMTTTASPLRFGTNNAVNATLDTAGNLGVGTTAASTNRIDALNTLNSTLAIRLKNASTGTAADARLILENDQQTGGLILRGGSHSSAPNHVVLYNNTANPITFNTNGAERARIDGSGMLLVGQSSATGDAKIQVSNGVRFGSTLSSDANTFDYYEEGTFTPVVVGLVTAGAGTYTSQVGRYTRTGNRVHFSITLNWSAHTGTGEMAINGLPFTSSNQAGAAWVCNLRFDNLAFTGQLTAAIGSNATQINLRQMTTNAAATGPAIDTAALLQITGTYEV